jgi:alpha-glucosidase
MNRKIAWPLILLIFTTVTGRAQPGQDLSLVSPGGHILFHLVNDAGGIAYSINYRQKEIISRGRMGFEFINEPPLGKGLSIVEKKTLAVHNTWYPAVRVKRARMEDRYNSLWLSLKEDTGLRRSMELEVRAYDDGIAFRYKLPAAAAIGDRVITRELTGFPFSGNAKAWVAQYGGYTSSQESEFKPLWLRDLTRQTVAGLPLLIQVDTSVFAAVTEAAIDHYPGTYIGSDSLQDNHVMLTTRLAPLPGEPVDGAKARFNDSVYTPWRVIMLAETPGRLIESGIIENLNPPCALKDPSWIKPGISAWDHWWSGEVKMDMPPLGNISIWQLARVGPICWWTGSGMALLTTHARILPAPRRSWTCRRCWPMPQVNMSGSGSGCIARTSIGMIITKKHSPCTKNGVSPA